MQSLGLVGIPTERLEALLRAVHAGKVVLPVSPQHLMLGGFGDVCDRMGVLSGLDATGLRAVLVSVLAERKEAARREAARR